METSVGSLICAALVALPIAALLVPESFAGADRRALLSVALLGLFPTGLATFVMYWLIARAGARFTAGSNYLAPAVSALIGVWLLSESLGAGGWIGLALILAGVFLSEGRAAAWSGRLMRRDRRPSAHPLAAAPPPRPGSPRSRR
jgi:drug/metabolite transporter (DMT)-like permease